ncbi:MAG: hypothetical protein JWR50_93 [Mucilaginibacter sp.]|nr:hypothetical protein [Mucilaginibacter sp.]
MIRVLCFCWSIKVRRLPDLIALMEIYQYKHLLDQVSAITERYKKVNELTGENFNVFRILKIESSEVRMHSAFIAELLNPNGTHGQKDAFLKLFVNFFCFKENLIDTKSCKVKVEEHIGAISEDKTQGGRIDIIVTDKQRNQIIIENKIYAGDQQHQLTRYYNHSFNADLIYLTLDGRLPDDSSKGELEEGIHYKCYSYKHHILNWLEACRKEVTVNPIVREGLTHYINLIKYLTNQSINQNMQEELSDLLKSNIEASFSIFENLDKACEKISDDFGVIFKSECKKMGFLCEYKVDLESRYNGIFVWMPEWKHVSIGFQFQNYDKDFIYGLIQEDPNKFVIATDIRVKFESLPNNAAKSSLWWPWYRSVEYPYNNWSKYEAWKAILNGDMKIYLLEKIDEIVKMTKNIEL